MVYHIIMHYHISDMDTGISNLIIPYLMYSILLNQASDHLQTLTIKRSHVSSLLPLTLTVNHWSFGNGRRCNYFQYDVLYACDCNCNYTINYPIVTILCINMKATASRPGASAGLVARHSQACQQYHLLQRKLTSIHCDKRV